MKMFISLQRETMALPLASRIFLFFFQFALLYSAQGREAPKTQWKDVTDKEMYDITKHSVDEHFWIYAKQYKEMRDDGGAQMMADQNPEVDDFFWIYSKKAKETIGNQDDGCDQGAGDMHQKQEIDDIFWIYRKKAEEGSGRRVDGDVMHRDHFWIYTKKAKDVNLDMGNGDAQWMDEKQSGDNLWGYAKNPKGISPDDHGHDHHQHRHMKPSFHVFFTLEDLKIGKTMPLYFPRKPDPLKTHQLLSREESESIPFSSSELPHLLDYFSFSECSPQAKAMEYTIEQCELQPIKGEVKYCATSLEAMFDYAQQILGPRTKSRVLTTTYLSMKKTAAPLQNYTILKAPKQVAAPRMVGCHPMPYPYVVFYCHSTLQSENKLFQVSLGGPDGQRVEAVAVCHMDTSQWDPNQVSFRALNIEPGSSPVCHFFPVDSLIWVPLPQV
ncbi:hypothetical protein CDL15_Pgr010471 [Punica granatum]|uniref:BURP domain-containing protein n=1 Tax=Punica granatum TaxID=22663 RepID=A0A218XVJ1_PUNGR|nr:hypothetical protein CDL15_Pgr010471 [Punica granatum]